MISRKQTEAIWDAIRALPADDRPNHVRHAFDLVLLYLRQDNGEVMLTRDEMAADWLRLQTRQHDHGDLGAYGRDPARTAEDRRHARAGHGRVLHQPACGLERLARTPSGRGTESETAQLAPCVH